MARNRWATPYLYIVKTVFASREHEQAWNEWYENVHVPDMLTVPGVRACARYGAIAGQGRYLAIYEIDSPAVFDHPRYREVTGWGEWHQFVQEWTRTILCIEGAEDAFVGGAPGA